VITLNAIRVRHMRPRAALRLAWLARFAVAREPRSFAPLGFTFRRWRDRTASTPSPVVRTVDGKLLVLSPRLSLTLALSQTYAQFVTPPRDGRSVPWQRVSETLHRRIFSELWRVWRQPASPPKGDSEAGHSIPWQRGSETLRHRRIFSELWHVWRQPVSPPHHSQVRLRETTLAAHGGARPERTVGPAVEIDRGRAFDVRAQSIGFAGVVAPPALRSPGVLPARRLFGRRGSSRPAMDSPATGLRARAIWAPRTLRTTALQAPQDLHAQDQLVWHEHAQRARSGSPGSNLPEQRQTRTVPAVTLAYRAPKAAAPAETIAAPAVTREPAAPPAIDMNRLERDLWRQMERRVRIERERRGRQ
jgi:hypothetical protein